MLGGLVSKSWLLLSGALLSSYSYRRFVSCLELRVPCWFDVLATVMVMECLADYLFSGVICFRFLCTILDLRGLLSLRLIESLLWL